MLDCHECSRPRCFTTREEALVFVLYKAGWTLEPVWSGEKKNTPTPAEIKPSYLKHQTHGLSTILTGLSQHLGSHPPSKKPILKKWILKLSILYTQLICISFYPIYNWYQLQIRLQVMKICTSYFTIVAGFNLGTCTPCWWYIFIDTCQISVSAIYMYLVLCIWLALINEYTKRCGLKWPNVFSFSVLLYGVALHIVSLSLNVCNVLASWMVITLCFCYLTGFTATSWNLW